MATLVKADQGTPEWLQARVGIPTASRFNDIMSRTKNGYGAQRKNYIAELVIERLTNKPTEFFISAPMQWGTDNEPVARLQFSLSTGKDAEETGLWLHDKIPAGASPDGFVGKDATLEIKCPNTATHLDTLATRQIPKQYFAQVQGQMWITGRKKCYFVSFDPRLPENAQMIVIVVERDEKYIKELEEELIAFNKEVDEQVEFVTNYKGE